MDRSTPSFLRDLAERLHHVPGTYNIDDGDIDELIDIARSLEANETETDNAAAWLCSFDTGISSKTIFSVMTRHPVECYSIPHDPADFARCSRLLKLFPSWRGRMHEVAAKFPEWESLVGNWDKLESLLALEEDSQAPTYAMWDFMRGLRGDS